MKKNIILIIISVFVFSSLNAQNKKGIIYEYKKNQFTSSIGTKGFFQVGYIKRLTKNIGIGGSISRNKYTDVYEYFYSDTVQGYGSSITTDERSSIAFMANFKWNLKVKKRMQPVYMFGVGYATGIGLISRTYFGLDLHSKNDKYVLTPFFSTLDYDDGTTIGIKFTIKK
jgi:hypothetical protein